MKGLHELYDILNQAAREIAAVHTEYAYVDINYTNSDDLQPLVDAVLACLSYGLRLLKPYESTTDASGMTPKDDDFDILSQQLTALLSKLFLSMQSSSTEIIVFEYEGKSLQFPGVKGRVIDKILSEHLYTPLSLPVSGTPVDEMSHLIALNINQMIQQTKVAFEDQSTATVGIHQPKSQHSDVPTGSAVRTFPRRNVLQEMGYDPWGLVIASLFAFKESREESLSQVASLSSDRARQDEQVVPPSFVGPFMHF